MIGSVVAIRRSGDALGARKLNGFQGGGKHVFQRRAFVRSEFPEDVADHFAGLATADAELEAGECVIAKMLKDGLDAIMAASGAFFAEAE